MQVELEPWERRERTALRFLPFPMLAVATLITMLLPGLSATHLVGTVGLAVTAAAWVLWWDTLHPSWQDEVPRLSPIYFFGLLALSAIMIIGNPWFGIFGFICYLRAFYCLTGAWRFVGVGLIAPLIAFSQMGGVEGIRFAGPVVLAVMILFNLVVAGGFSYVGWRTIERDRNRRTMLAELAETNRRLEGALEENAGLHAQLLVQAREAGMLDERQRMAREIHDTLAQGLTGIIAQLQAAEQAGETPVKWRRHLTTAATLARDSLSEARRSVHAIRPEALEGVRLPDALTDVVQRWSSIHDVATELVTTGTARPMHADIEVALLRTAQEALANVAKHANASRVGLTLSYMEDVVTLDVRDDGVGFVPDAVAGNGSADGGFGLTGMRQRVQRLAGRLAIESEPGAGTAISATVPAIPAGAAVGNGAVGGVGGAGD